MKSVSVLQKADAALSIWRRTRSSSELDWGWEVLRTHLAASCAPANALARNIARQPISNLNLRLRFIRLFQYSWPQQTDHSFTTQTLYAWMCPLPSRTISYFVIVTAPEIGSIIRRNSSRTIPSSRLPERS